MSTELENWRKQIDALDSELLKILAKRMEIVRQVGEYKKSQGIAPLDNKRWQEVVESKLAQAGRLNLSLEFIQKMYTLIHEEALNIEEK